MSSLKIVTLTSENTCGLCNNALAKYSCPKCNQLYCTLECYQSLAHSECSEQFYKSLVQEHLESQLKDDKSEGSREQKIEDILKRFHEENLLNDVDEENEDDLDSDDEPAETIDDLGARLNGIDLDDSEQVWKHLTENERKDFEAFLLSGDVAQFITMWTPWWDFKSTGVLDEEAWIKWKVKCPKLVKIARFNELSGKPPAKCVENNLINVLATYVFLQRYFNGEVEEFSLEFTMYLWTLSLNIRDGVNFDTAALAIESVFHQCLEEVDLGIVTDAENKRHVKSDVNSLLGGPHASERKFYILSALSDLKSIFINAKSCQKQQNCATPESKGEFFAKFTGNQRKLLATFTNDNIKAAVRKIDYYLSFVSDLYLESSS